MKKFAVGFLAVVGVFALLAVGFAACVAAVSLRGQEPVPSRVILEVDLDAGVVEMIPDDLTAHLLMEGVPELQDVIDALDRAAGDQRVKALVARVGGAGIGLAHVQELRDAILRFKATGKPTLAFSETFGEFGPGNGSYYLATAFDEIFLQPSGDVGLTGLMYEMPFIRGLLDKLEVVPQMGQRYEYKNAMNFYTHTEFTEAHREALAALMESQFKQIVRGIADARRMTEEHVVELFDRGPFLGPEALEAGLVDQLAYRDEVYEQAKEVAGERARVVPFADYLLRAGRPNEHGETIALIHGYGAVVRGAGGYSPVDGSVTMGADAVVEAFRSAIDSSRVKAIVFRVDSPGGSYVASDTIRRETVRAREAKKPVIVSMGNLAGSGGYYVALEADKIVAEPGTITASIGVLGGKLVLSGLWQKVGVSWDDVRTSDHSAMFSTNHTYAPAEWARFEAGLDRIYDDFTRKVSEGRDLPLEDVLELARGRIWTGEDALALGLVDALGGVDVAMRLAREAAGIAPDAPIRIRRYPARRSQLELLLDLTDGVASPTPSALARTAAAIQPQVRLLERLGLGRDPGVLSMPELLP